MDDMKHLMAALPLWYGVFVFSLTCHEAAHAFAARRGGDPSAYLGGQQSLNPIPHIRREMFGMVVVPLISFFLQGGQWMIGWASVPTDLAWELRYPKRAAVMAVSGPAANFLLAFLAATGLKIMLGAGWIDLLPLGTGRSPFLFDAEGGVLEVVAAGLFIAVTLNLLLGVFNLLPIPPLDGAALPGLFLDTERRYQFRMWGARYALIGLVLSWYVVGMVFRPVYGIVLRWVFAP